MGHTPELKNQRGWRKNAFFFTASSQYWRVHTVHHHPFTTLPRQKEAGIDNQWKMIYAAAF